MSFHFTPATSTAAAPAMQTRGLSMVPSLILDPAHRGHLLLADSLADLADIRPAAMRGLRTALVNERGQIEPPEDPRQPPHAPLGSAGQMLIGREVFELLREQVRDDLGAIRQCQAPVQRCDHLLLIQQTWELEMGPVHAMLSAFVLAGRWPSAEVLAMLCERYGVPVLVWVADATGQTFVRGFNLPEHRPQSANAGRALQ